MRGRPTRRVLWIALVALAFVTHAHANPPPPAASPGFDPDTARATGALAVVRDAYAGNDLDAARRALSEALAQSPADLAGELRYAARVDPDPGVRVARLSEVPAAHALGAWAKLRAAEALESVDCVRALGALEGLPPQWSGARAARSVRARCLLTTGRTDEAIGALRALVAEAPRSSGAASVALPLADLLASRPDPTSREEALALYRRVASRAPLADAGRSAAERAERVLASLPTERRAALAAESVDGLRARAEALAGAMHHAEAEAAYARLAEADPPGRCAARLEQGRAMTRRRAHADAAHFLEQLARDCAEPDVRAWSLYLAGRSHVRRGAGVEARADFDELARTLPTHRLADDALLRAAVASKDAGDLAGFVERLAQVPVRHPAGDVRGEARFQLAWHLRSTGELRGALAQLDASLAEGPVEDDEDIRGRARYWRARLLGELGRVPEALAAYEALVAELPLSYYAQQALAHLDALDASRAAILRAGLRGPDAPLTFPMRPELADPRFATALALLRTGDVDAAHAELTALGFFGEGADPDALWLACALLDRGGRHAEATQLARRRLGAFLTAPPVGRTRALWRLAYPRALAPLVEDAASAEGVPAAFVRAIAREESGFDPDAVSSANAVGVIQLIEPTARRFARELALPSDADALRRPEINLRIGARFLGFLFRRYPQNAALVPGAYNAGEGATDRWVRERGTLPLDAWIEEIPYEESRRYTRRVLQSYGTYAWLDDGALPALPERVAR